MGCASSWESGCVFQVLTGRTHLKRCFVSPHSRCEAVLKGVLELSFPEYVKFCMERNNSVFLNHQEFGSGEALKLVRAVVNVLSHFCF